MSDSEDDENVLSQEEQEDKSPAYLSQATGIFSGLFYFVSALGALFFRLIQLVAVVFSWFWFVVSILPYLFIVGCVTVAIVPYVAYQDVLVEELDFWLRCRLEPYYYAGPRELILFIQLLYDPLICWYNAFGKF